MPICPEQVREVLSQVDPARQRSGWPVGLRDGALLALIAAGLSAEEIAGLHASSITMDRENLLIEVRRHGITWRAMLPADLGSWLLAWLTERLLWGLPAPVITGPQGPLSPMGIHQVLYRYRRQGRACE